jgi:hypothetical protein
VNQPVSTPLSFAPDTVLTREQVAAALSVSVDTIERSGVPVSYALGDRTPRYVWRQVIAYIERGVAA